MCLQCCKRSFCYTSGTHWEEVCCTGVSTPLPSCYNQVASFRWLYDCWLQWWNSVCLADGNRWTEIVYECWWYCLSFALWNLHFLYLISKVISSACLKLLWFGVMFSKWPRGMFCRNMVINSKLLKLDSLGRYLSS